MKNTPMKSHEPLFRGACTQLVTYLLSQKKKLLRANHDVNDLAGTGSKLEAHLVLLSKEGTSAHDRAHAAILVGHLYFKKQAYTESLQWFKDALDHDPHHGVVWPMIGWTCLNLGLTRDAHEAQLGYESYLKRAAQSEIPYVQTDVGRLGEVIAQLSALTQNLDLWKSRGWLTWNLKTADPSDFDFMTCRFLYDCMSGYGGEFRTTLSRFYKRWPKEWVPAMLLALLAYHDQDSALCSEFLDKTQDRATDSHRSFVLGLSQGLLSGLTPTF